jgi:hypothetical protein
MKTKYITLEEEITPQAESVPEEETTKTAVDYFIEEFGDDWPLEVVKFGFDDGGRVLEILIEESKAAEFRTVCPFRYGEDRVWTVVIGVPEGWGAER